MYASDSSPSEPPRANFHKQNCEAAVEAPPTKKPAKGGRKRRVSASTKKERKKQQNKTAALRYRQKKKNEKIDFEQQQRELEEKNASLRATIGSMEAEIAYLTKFWSEVQSKQQQQRCQ